MDDLQALGVGITLHFRLLKYLVVFFLIASIVTLPILLLGMAGGRLNTVPMAINLDALRVSKLSIANIGLPSSLLGDIDNLQPWGFGTFNRRVSSIIIAACDLVMIILFFVFALYLRLRIAVISEDTHASTLKAANYAVYVTGLPRNATEDEVWLLLGLEVQAGALSLLLLLVLNVVPLT